MMRVFYLAVIVSILLLSVRTNAQEDTSGIKTYALDSVVVTANKIETVISGSPSKIELVSGEKIIKSNGTTLADILKNTNTVTIKSYGSSPLAQTLSINGLGSEHTLILLDGVRLTSFQNPAFDLSVIPKEIISRIEIAGSGMSSLYGSDALGGVINIISRTNSRQDSGKSMGTGVSAATGSYGQRLYSLSLNHADTRFASDVFYSYEKSDGNFEYYYDNGIEKKKKERENAAYKNYDGGVILSFFPGSSSMVKLFTTYVNQYKNVPGIETGLPQPVTLQKDRNWNTIISYNSTLSPVSSLSASFNFQNNLMNYSTLPVLTSFYKNLIYAFNTQYNLSYSSVKINTGYDFINSSFHSNDVEGAPVRNLHAFSASSAIDIIKGLQIFPSTRMDYFSDLDKSVLTGKLGFNYKPFESTGFHIKGSAGNNYRAPSFNELYYEQSGNKNLKPEKSINGEAGALWYFKSFVDAYFDFTFTYIGAKDKIVWTPKFPSLLWSPVNISESISRVYSFSFNCSKQLGEGFKISGDFGVGFTDSKKISPSYKGDPSAGKQIIYIPENSVKASLMLEYKNAGVNLFYSYTGKKYADAENKHSLPPVRTLDGSILYNYSLYSMRIQLRIEVNNILNEDYQVVQGYPMPLRNYLLKVSINY